MQVTTLPSWTLVTLSLHCIHRFVVIGCRLARHILINYLSNVKIQCCYFLLYSVVMVNRFTKAKGLWWYFFFFFSLRLLSVLPGHSFFSSPPKRPMTSDFEGFSIPDFIHNIYFPIFILEKEPVFSLFECSVLNKGTTGTILITSLVCRGSWLEIEPGTSRTRSQHYTTRLWGSEPP